LTHLRLAKDRVDEERRERRGQSLALRRPLFIERGSLRIQRLRILRGPDKRQLQRLASVVRPPRPQGIHVRDRG